jgi:hypothetical protein
VAAVPVVAAVLTGRAAERGAPATALLRATRFSVPVLLVATFAHIFFSEEMVRDFFFTDHGDIGLETLALFVPIFLLVQFAATAVVITATVVAVRVARARRAGA